MYPLHLAFINNSKQVPIHHSGAYWFVSLSDVNGTWIHLDFMRTSYSKKLIIFHCRKFSWIFKTFFIQFYSTNNWASKPVRGPWCKIRLDWPSRHNQISCTVTLFSLTNLYMALRHAQYLILIKKELIWSIFTSEMYNYLYSQSQTFPPFTQFMLRFSQTPLACKLSAYIPSINNIHRLSYTTISSDRFLWCENTGCRSILAIPPELSSREISCWIWSEGAGMG